MDKINYDDIDELLSDDSDSSESNDYNSRQSYSINYISEDQNVSGFQ